MRPGCLPRSDASSFSTAMPATLRGRAQRDGGPLATQFEAIGRARANGIGDRASDVEMFVRTIVLLIRTAGRWHLADPQRYSRERLTEFAADLLSGRR